MLHGLLASFEVLGIDEHGEIYRKAFRRPSGFVFAQPCRGVMSVLPSASPAGRSG
jgi:hypothetical protein